MGEHENLLNAISFYVSLLQWTICISICRDAFTDGSLWRVLIDEEVKGMFEAVWMPVLRGLRTESFHQE